MQMCLAMSVLRSVPICILLELCSVLLAGCNLTSSVLCSILIWMSHLCYFNVILCILVVFLLCLVLVCNMAMSMLCSILIIEIQNLLNFRGISLLPIIITVFIHILNSTMHEWRECKGKIHKKQVSSGQKKKKNMFTLTSLINVKEKKKREVVAIIDYTKAFDNTDNSRSKKCGLLCKKLTLSQNSSEHWKQSKAAYITFHKVFIKHDGRFSSFLHLC